MDKGKRIVKSLHDSKLEKNIRLSHELLFSVFSKNAISLSEIQKRLTAKWKEINNKDPSFYLIWRDPRSLSGCESKYDLSLEGLIRNMYESGNLTISFWRKERPYYTLTTS